MAKDNLPPTDWHDRFIDAALREVAARASSPDAMIRESGAG
jgi:hypothetical protein